MAAGKVPGRAWVVVFAGTAINLCLGILYAWSVWTKVLINVEKAGQLITEGPAAGWTYITNAQAAIALGHPGNNTTYRQEETAGDGADLGPQPILNTAARNHQ